MIKQITIEELQSNFDYYIDKVGEGNSFKIVSEHGTVMLLPHESIRNPGEGVEYLRNHNDAC